MNGLRYRNGVLVLWRRPPAGARRLEFAIAVLGGLCVALHPTPAAIYGTEAARAVFILAVLLLLPAWRRIVVQPAFALFLASGAIALFGRDPLVLALPFVAYPVFFHFFYNPTVSYRVYFGIFLVLGALAVLQAVTPDSFLAAHRITDSATNPDGDFLQSYRPASLYSAQIYYSQFLLLLVPVLVICRRFDPALMGAGGVISAVAGSTAGTLLVFFLLLLAPRRGGSIALLSYLAVVGLIYLIDPARFHYNFSLLDLTGSVQARLAFGAPGADLGAGADAASVLGQTTLNGILTLLSALGVMLAGMLLPLAGLNARRLRGLVLATLALISVQVIHNTMGSVFSALSLAGFAALQWEIIRPFGTAAMRRNQEPVMR